MGFIRSWFIRFRLLKRQKELLFTTMVYLSVQFHLIFTIKIGDEGDKFYICLEGKLNLYQKRPIKDVTDDLNRKQAKKMK
jgi:hypothetical protein